MTGKRNTLVAVAAFTIGAMMAIGVDAQEQEMPKQQPVPSQDQVVQPPKAAKSDLLSSCPVINVRDLGAKGDGIADDTEYLQKAVDSGGEVFIPSGKYVIKKTLIISKKTSFIMRGQGMSPFLPRGTSTTLMWGGEDGGTLIKSAGLSGCIFQNMNLAGRTNDSKVTGGGAGVLFSTSWVKNHANMINKMENMGFYQADIGIEMGGEGPDGCNSDMVFDFVTFSFLKRGFVAKNGQAVDFTFNFLFAMNCDKVLHFEKGGNLLVNTAQMTQCKLFLEISGGGMSGVYACNNIRVEENTGGKTDRLQLLRCLPASPWANVTFTGFNDCQHDWKENLSEKRMLPLCEIGPGSIVTFGGSVFFSPVASVLGSDKGQAVLILRECAFNNVKPETAVTANSCGFFKVINAVDAKNTLLPDVVKWPSLPMIEIQSAEEHRGIEKNKARDQYLLVGSDAPQTLVTNFSDPYAKVGILAKGSARADSFEKLVYMTIPDMLIGKTYVYVARYPKAPGPGYSFTSMKNATLYLFVMEAGTPKIPDDWKRTEMKATGKSSFKLETSDAIYTRKVRAGETVTIPENGVATGNGYFALPHACAVAPEE